MLRRNIEDLGGNSHTRKSPLDKAQEHTQLYSGGKRRERVSMGVLKPYLIVLETSSIQSPTKPP